MPRPVPARRRRTANLNTVILEHLDEATEFTDDPQLQDPVWLIDALRRHPNYLGVLERMLTPAPPPNPSSRRVRRRAGRKRLEGSWPIVFIVYVALGEVAMEAFHQDHASSPLWIKAGFRELPCYETLRSRFVELEQMEAERRARGEKTAFKTVADLLIRQARRHEDRIGRFFHVDGTGWQTHAALEHCCTDRAACRAASKRSSKHLDRLTDVELQDERKGDANLAVEEVLRGEGMPTPVGEDERYRYLMLGGHLYRTLDKTSGARMYGGKSGKRKKKFWLGGVALPAVDHFVGVPLAIEHISADVLEHQAYERLQAGVIEAVGEPPLAMTGDRAHSIKEVFELNTRAGIASVIPWRKWSAGMTREDVRCEAFDEHGVPRCEYCGGPGDQLGPGLGLYFARGDPRIRFRCLLVHTDECKRAQSIACERDWRMLLPLSRTTELYHALRESHQSYERIHRHWRDRYKSAGKNLDSRLKRRGIAAQQLRSDAALVIEWFRLCLRHGWLGSARRREPGELKTFSGMRRLEAVLASRKKRRLNRPYGQAAIKLGLARAGPAPP